MNPWALRSERIRWDPEPLGCRASESEEQASQRFSAPHLHGVSIPIAVNDPTLLPALASVVFFRISGYSALKVTEQARLRSQLEGAVAVSLVDVPEDCRILMDAPDGMAVADAID